MTNMPTSVRTIPDRWLPALLMLVLACAWGTPAASVQAADSTYQATVSVPDTSTEARGKAFADALAHVLSRVAGHSLGATPDVDTAASYVQRYQYHRADEGASEPFVLSVTFAPGPVRHLAREMGARVDEDADDGMAAADTGGEDTDEDGAAARFEAVPASDRVVWITGIGSGRDFADAVHALESVSGIDDVAVTAAEDDAMQVRLHTTLPPEHLAEALADGGDFSADGQPRSGAVASLRWQK